MMVALVVAAGCDGDGGQGGRDGGADRDGAASVDGAVSADGAVPCGPTTCEAGSVCCDPSCGICGDASGACPAITCADAGPGNTCGGIAGITCGDDEVCDYEAGCGFADETGVCKPRPESCPDMVELVCGCDGITYGNECEAYAAGADVSHEGACEGGACDAQDARGEGACELVLGVAWNGSDCMFLSGCSCAGADCDALFESIEACEAAYADCGGATCGTRGSGPCEPGEFCDFPDGAMCGATDIGGTCRPQPEGCITVEDPVCGCDGVTYGNACLANAAGVDVLHDDPCEGSCEPEEARGVGTCRHIIGFRWTGSACEAVTGCECTGADCGSLAATEDECRAAHEHCPGGGGVGFCGGIAGFTCGAGEYCDYPEDATCGIGDAAGTCRPRPDVCTTDVRPVCGCDGNDYTNACQAYSAGTDVAFEGKCDRTGRD